LKIGEVMGKSTHGVLEQSTLSTFRSLLFNEFFSAGQFLVSLGPWVTEPLNAGVLIH